MTNLPPVLTRMFFVSSVNSLITFTRVLRVGATWLQQVALTHSSTRAVRNILTEGNRLRLAINERQVSRFSFSMVLLVKVIIHFSRFALKRKLIIFFGLFPLHVKSYVAT
jgi:hypothetical protein